MELGTLKSILVADDDPTIRALISECLTSIGYSVSCADCGAECLQKLKVSTPDIIILDMLMPDITGIEVVSQIRLSTQQAKLPVILLSADSQTAEKAIAADKSTTFMQKPFALKDLLAAIESF